MIKVFEALRGPRRSIPVVFLMAWVLIMPACGKGGLQAKGDTSITDRSTKVTHGWLGISMLDLNGTATIVPSAQTGVLVSEVFTNSAAESAGLRTGDIIIEFDGQPVSNSLDLKNRLKDMAPGKTVIVLVMRGESPIKLNVKLGEMSERAVFENEFAQGFIAYNAGDYQKAVEKFQLALQQAHSLGNDEMIGRTLSNLGFSYQALKDYPQAIKFYSEGALYYEATRNSKELAVLLGNIGAIRTQMGAYRMATEVLDRSLDVSQKAMGVANREAKLEMLRTRINLLYFKALSHGQLGEISQEVDSYQQMVADFSKANKLGNHEGQFKLTVQENFRIGLAFEGIGEYKAALDQYEDGFQKLPKENTQANLVLAAQFLAKKGKLHRLLSQYQQAIWHFHASVTKYREAENSLAQAEGLVWLADLYSWISDHDAAMRYYKEAFQLYQEAGTASKQVETLAAMLEAMGGVGYLREAEQILLMESDPFRRYLIKAELG